MVIDENYDHPHGMDVDASVLATGYTSITRPAEDIQMLSQGPLIDLFIVITKYIKLKYM